MHSVRPYRDDPEGAEMEEMNKPDGAPKITPELRGSRLAFGLSQITYLVGLTIISVAGLATLYVSTNSNGVETIISHFFSQNNSTNGG